MAYHRPMRRHVPLLPPAIGDAAAALAALGHEARLEIYRTLVRAGDAGLPIHRIQARLEGMPRSTLAHHLQMLVQAGLVTQQKSGAEVVSRARYEAMRSLVSYLTEECCTDLPDADSPRREPQERTAATEPRA
jgi:ArsR family transcriptional regulator, arsenate/arsenite/antimonite-responsive transcriptional repressor